MTNTYAPSQPRHGFHVERDVMVPMRDGVRLATDIYRPCHGDGRLLEEPVPALLVRTSYDKTAPEWDDVIPYYVRRGYAFVVQDLRSRFRSEGDGHYYHTINPWEGDDGFDTVEWLAGQDWCTGKIGTLGSSHRAIVQTQLALRKPPHLAAMWVEAGPTNIYRHEAREGGAMSFQMFGALHLHALDCHEVGDDPEKARVIFDAMRDMREWLQKFPLKPGETALRVAPDLEKTAFDYYYRGEYDDWWAQEAANQEPYFDQHADVPMTLSCGWYDNFVGATASYYVEMNSKNKSPARLILGAWCHGGMRAPESWHGDVDTGQESVWTNAIYNPERLRFFDQHLKGMPAAENDPPVRIYVMGTGDGTKTDRGNLNHGGYWRDEAEWPIARTEFQTLYMHEDGTLDPFASTDNDGALTYTFDPEHPVPTVGGPIVGMFEITPPEDGGPALEDVPDFMDQWTLARDNLREVVEAGGFHQKEGPQWIGARPPYPLLKDRPDVLAFETRPLDDDTEVTGEVSVKLWVSSTAIDTDFTVKLIDVYPESDDYPDGYHLNLTDTIQRMRYRNSWTDPEMMTPGEPCEVTITLWPTSNVFKKGHRIRIDISSSNFPRFDVNPNTGEPVGRHTKMIKAENTVYTSAGRASRVILPIVPSPSQ